MKQFQKRKLLFLVVAILCIAFAALALHPLAHDAHDETGGCYACKVASHLLFLTAFIAALLFDLRRTNQIPALEFLKSTHQFYTPQASRAPPLFA